MKAILIASVLTASMLLAVVQASAGNSHAQGYSGYPEWARKAFDPYR